MSQYSAPDVPFSPRQFRDTLGHYASGITIVSGIDDGEPIGFTCQSFFSVSIEPPLISFSVMKTSTTYPRIAATGRFAVNVLAHDQHTIANQFARSGTDKWAGVAWNPAASGNPIIADTLIPSRAPQAPSQVRPPGPPRVRPTHRLGVRPPCDATVTNPFHIGLAGPRHAFARDPSHRRRRGPSCRDGAARAGIAPAARLPQTATSPRPA